MPLPMYTVGKRKSLFALGAGLFRRVSVLFAIATLAGVGTAAAQTASREPGGEANLVLPDLSRVTFLGGIDGHTLLLAGLVVSALGLLFGLVIYQQLKNLQVHQSMREISELI